MKLFFPFIKSENPTVCNGDSTLVLPTDFATGIIEEEHCSHITYEAPLLD